MSSMGDCSEYSNPHHHPQQQSHHRHGHSQQQTQQQQQQTQQQHHHQPQHHQAKLSAALSSSALSHHQASGQILPSTGPPSSNTTLTRGSRRSSYGPSHYQQQLVQQTVNFHDGLNLGDNISVGSGSIISNHSGQRYMPDLQYGTLGNRIIHHNERYVIDDSSCLQPPSPAPSNDHYVMGMPSPSPTTVHHYPERHFTLQARTMSPSKNRYRHSLTENYRDMSPQCDRYIPPPAHFLNTTNPLAAADSYGYLNSNVHTPVKRYVPTPPPQEPTYQPQTQLMTALLTQTAVNASQNRNNHLTSTLPYRFRVKSCPNEQTISPPQGFDTSDHYATPPRVRPLKCPSSLTPSCSASGSTLSSQAVNSGRQSRQSTEYLIARTPSADFLDQTSCRVATPVSVMSEPNGSASCLHCNTLRRATGVHQTTQTSGPISPQPLSISSATESTGRQSPISPASVSSPITTAQSSNSLLQSQHNHHQPQSQQQHHQMQQVASNIMTTTQSQPQISLENYSSMEHRDISTIPRYHTKQQQQSLSQQPSAHSSEQSIMTNSNSRSILIQYQQQNIISQPPQQQMQPPPAVQSVPPQQMIPQQSPQVQQQPSQPSQPQPIPAPVAPAPLPGPSMQPHSPPMSDSPASTLQRNAQQQILRPIGPNMSRKQRIKEYMKHETAKFFGVDNLNEEYERHKWDDRQKRFAIRRFGQLKDEYDFSYRNNNANQNVAEEHAPPVDRPDVLPAQSQDERDTEQNRRQRANPQYTYDNGADNFVVKAERKPSVPTVIWCGISFLIQSITRKRMRRQKQWSRSFAPAHVELTNEDNEHCDGLQPIQDEEAFFDTPAPSAGPQPNPGQIVDNSRQLFVSDGDRGLGGATGSGIINGWRTRSSELQLQAREGATGALGQRISSHILDGVLDNSMRPIGNKVKLLRPDLLDDRYDYRPFFTYWINTVQILVLIMSLICYGFGPVGWGMEDKTAQVLVTSLNLQEVHHRESRNVWIGLRNTDIVHLGAKYGACMRRDSRISDVIAKTRKHERETACCIRNDDSGCVQSSQADCSMRGLWPTKTIATWKKWSPGDSGPGGRISGSVCGLDPKYCDAPASIAPHEWPDDITKWPICRKNNQLSQRFRFKDHTAEHMVCEVIGHPCCIGVYGECRITTREYCDFVSGYFHEEASLCSQVSCLNDVCGMFPFIASEYPDQFYRLFTSLCLHAGIIHLAITVAFQHLLMSDLERLIGPLRMAILYIGSGIAGNLTSAIFVPYKAEVGPLPSLAGVLSSLMIQLILCHWKSLKKPHVAMIKLLVIGCILFGFGTLPWQANFTGLIAGLIFGIGITLTFVPFVNVAKHSRKSKVNLIWTCVILQLIIYAVMFIIFYVFPLLFSSFNFIDGNQLTGHGSAHGYHDHYNLYESFPNYNGNGHGHNHGSGGGIINNGNPYVTTYDSNNKYKTLPGHNGGILHNHHEYSGGGGVGGSGGISMSGGINRISSSNNNKNNNLMKGTLCEKGQCVQRQPRSADTNA